MNLIFELESEMHIAHDLMQNYIYFNEKAIYNTAEPWLDSLIHQFIESQITEYVEIYKLLQNWKPEIINSFIKIDKRRISSGPIEAKNRLIKV